MSDISSAAAAFLAGGRWSEARVEPVAGDLSQRRYFRLCSDERETAILMDSSLDIQSALRFRTISGWLRGAGFSAPEILAGDLNGGFLVLEDFGNQTAGQVLEESPDFRDQFLGACVELLVALRRVPPPKLNRPNAAELAEWTAVTEKHYPSVDPDAQRRFRDLLETELPPLLENCSVSLRDFHADNVMWLSEREGVARLGLLDYQDAFITHPVYDLVSVLTDARVSIGQKLRNDCIRAYALQSNDKLEALHSAFALFSAQRNMRILGVFAQAARNGKPHHLPKLARVQGYLTEALEHPVFDAVRDEVLQGLPDPIVAAERLAR